MSRCEGINSLGLIDSDYDSIPDDLDACILERENFNKFQDEDGCPDKIQLTNTGDFDYDGIPNEFDMSIQ